MQDDDKEDKERGEGRILNETTDFNNVFLKLYYIFNFLLEKANVCILRSSSQRQK